ncbi:MAG: hypothetical protein Q9205_006150 [Flavoplaca limonia]
MTAAARTVPRGQLHTDVFRCQPCPDSNRATPPTLRRTNVPRAEQGLASLSQATTKRLIVHLILFYIDNGHSGTARPTHGVIHQSIRLSAKESLELLIQGDTNARKLNPAKIFLTAMDSIPSVGPDDPREGRGERIEQDGL